MFCSTKKSAQTKLNEVLSEIGDGTYKEIPEIRFNEFADLWINSYAETKLKPIFEQVHVRRSLWRRKFQMFNDVDFNRKQSGLLEASFEAVRKDP